MLSSEFSVPSSKFWGRCLGRGDAVAHVFISYTRSDRMFVETLKGELRSVDLKIWVDTENLRAGEDWREGIDDAIKNALLFIVVMTPEAKASEYVTYEWSFAMGLGITIMPIILKPTNLHHQLERLQYFDFTDRDNLPWRNFLYQVREIIKEYTSVKPIFEKASVEDLAHMIRTLNDPNTDEKSKQNVAKLLERIDHPLAVQAVLKWRRQQGE